MRRPSRSDRRVLDAVGRGAPQSEALRPRVLLAGKQRGGAGAVVREGIDAREPLPDQYLLQPDAFRAIDREDLCQRVAVAVAAPPAIAELDARPSDELGQGRASLLDEGQRSSPRLTERRRRRLGSDQPHRPAAGELERLAVDHGGDHAGLRLGQLARRLGMPRSRTAGEPHSRKRQDGAPDI